MSIGSIKFDGTNQYLEVPPSNSLILSGDLTIEFFCKCSVTPGNNGILLSAGPSGPLLISVNRAVENNVRLYFNITDMSSYFPQKSINDNLWHHIAIVRKGMLTNNITVFVDGQIDAYITNTSTWDYGSRFIIGGYLYNEVPYTPNSYNGFLSNLRICNNAVYNGPFQVQLNNLTPIPGTVLLLNMAFNNPYLDSSPNSIVITVNNNPTPMQDSPFDFLNNFLILSTDKKTVISYNANIDVTGITITIPNTVTTIGAEALHYCRLLTSVVIPSSVTSIAKNAFYMCTSLTSVTIPSSVTSIAQNAFSECVSLKNITLQQTDSQQLTALGEKCFFNTNINSQSILEMIIMGYSNIVLNEAGIPASLIEFAILNKMFLYLSEDKTKIVGYDLYANSIILEKPIVIPSSVTAIEAGALQGSSLHSISIPSKVISIGDNAFKNCISLTSIILQRSNTQVLTSLGVDCFLSSGITIQSVLEMVIMEYERTNLINTGIPIIIVDDAILSKNFLVLSGDKKIVTGYNQSTNIMNKTILIPNSVTSIALNAFLNSASLSSIIIPKNVISIGSGAFQGCSLLTNITLQRPSSQELTTLGSNCFSNSGFTLNNFQSLSNMYNMGYTRYDLIKTGISASIVDNAIENEKGIVDIIVYFYYE